jgi:hypothetical protein
MMRDSTSDSSTRYPLILTCMSMRPRYSILPSGSLETLLATLGGMYRARSPVLYSLGDEENSGAKGLSMNFSLLSLGLFKYPRATLKDIVSYDKDSLSV